MNRIPEIVKELENSYDKKTLLYTLYAMTYKFAKEEASGAYDLDKVEIVRYMKDHLNDMKWRIEESQKNENTSRNRR